MFSALCIYFNKILTQITIYRSLSDFWKCRIRSFSGTFSTPKFELIDCSGTTLATFRHLISLLMEKCSLLNSLECTYDLNTFCHYCITWIDLTIDSSLYKSKSSKWCVIDWRILGNCTLLIAFTTTVATSSNKQRTNRKYPQLGMLSPIGHIIPNCMSMKF